MPRLRNPNDTCRQLMDLPFILRALGDVPERPAAVVDLDAVDANVDEVLRRLGDSGRSLRVATKSVRHVGVLRRILDAGGTTFRGLMCYAADEAAWLAGQGFDDLFVAYPTLRPAALDRCAAAAASGATIALAVDCREHVEALGRAAGAHGTALGAVIDVDVSWRPGGGAHIGVRRSPVRDAGSALALAQVISATPGVRLDGVMGYEAHVAGIADRSPFTRASNAARRAMKRVAVPVAARLRGDVVGALRDAGFALRLVNGGGSGSVVSTAADPAVTEVTAGSAFLAPHLFDHYDQLTLRPAAFVALEVTRVSDAGYVTCGGGGYVASGPPGRDRLPLPVWPCGLGYVPAEGAGEVQTPFRVPAGTAVRPGDDVLVRHAKAGELAERFATFHLLRRGKVVASEPTYRGAGVAFG